MSADEKDFIICDDCGGRFPDNDDGDWNRFMEKCGKCYAEFLTQQMLQEEDSMSLAKDIKILKTSRVLLRGKPGVLTKQSNATYRLELDDGSVSTVFSDEDYLMKWLDVLEHRSCFHRMCTSLPLITCSREVHWLCEEHCEEECCAYRLDASAAKKSAVVAAVDVAVDSGSNQEADASAFTKQTASTPAELTPAEPSPSTTPVAVGVGDGSKPTLPQGGEVDVTERTSLLLASRKGNSGELPPHLPSLPSIPLVAGNSSGVADAMRRAQQSSPKVGAPMSMPTLLKSLSSLFTGLTPEQSSSIDMFGVERQYAMLVMATDLAKRVKSKYAYDANLGPRPDYYELNKWILCDAYFSVSSITVLILARVYVKHKDTGELYYNYKNGRTKCVHPNIAMFLFDAYTGEPKFNLNVQVSKYEIVNPETLPRDVPPPDLEKMEAAMQEWKEEKRYRPSLGPNRDENGRSVMTKEYLDHMAAILGDECGRTQAQIEVDKRVAALEDFIEKSGRRNARTAAVVTPKIKPKRAAAAPPVGGYDPEDDPLFWLSLDDPPYTPIIVPCPTLPSAVSSGPASSGRASGVGASRSSSGSGSGSASSTSVSSDSSSSVGSSSALNAKDVEAQVDASFAKWFGQIESVIDKRVAKATTEAVTTEIKALNMRTDIWTEKIFTSMDNQARKIEKCSADMAKLMFRMGQLEAGTAGHYSQVDLTMEAASAPSFSSSSSSSSSTSSAPSSFSSSSAPSSAPSSWLKRSAATAELEDIDPTETRLARVEAKLEKLTNVLSNFSSPGALCMPGSLPTPSCSSPSSSSSSSSFCGRHESLDSRRSVDFAARMAAYFQEEDRELRERRRQSVLSDLGLPMWK